MKYFAGEYDVAVIGAGHAGIEAALASARLGANTIVFTINLDWIGNMACNPSIGGTSKGHLVREIDALGGEMGKAADATLIQSRILNLGKGPAVHSLRAQIDRREYTKYMKHCLENQKNLDLKQAEIVSLNKTEDGLWEMATQLEAVYKAKTVVIATGTFDSESIERPFAMERKDEALVRMACAANKKVIVLVLSGSGIDMSAWHDKVSAIIYGWYPGQAGMQAIADIMVGKINPSGKLPATIEKSFKDSPAYGMIPKGMKVSHTAKNVNELWIAPRHYDVEYKESVLVGYRWYESKNIEPLFPFGFGLSYTSFEYSSLDIKPEGKEFVVSFDIKNTGKMAGSEAAQVYVGDDECSLVRPAKELKGFDKVYLKVGETKRVSVRLDDEAFRFFDPIERKFKIEPGQFTVYVGASSADIRLTGKLTVE